MVLFLLIVILIVCSTLQQCYKELKPGAYGDLGKVMEGCNIWYAKTWISTVEHLN